MAQQEEVVAAHALLIKSTAACTMADPPRYRSSASRRDHSVEGQDGNPATPECNPLPERNPGTTNGEKSSGVANKNNIKHHRRL